MGVPVISFNTRHGRFLRGIEKKIDREKIRLRKEQIEKRIHCEKNRLRKEYIEKRTD